MTADSPAPDGIVRRTPIDGSSVGGGSPQDARGRLIAVAQAVIRTRGVAAVSVEELIAGAGVSPGDFEVAFADRTDCLVAVFDEVVEQARGEMLAAYRRREDWVQAVRGALSQLLAFLDRDANRARFMLVGSLSGEAPIRARRERLRRELAEALDAGRPRLDGTSLEPPFGPDAVVATVAAVLHGRLLQEPVPPLSPLCGSLMAVIVLPYLGVDAARGEVARAAVPSARRAGAPARQRNRLRRI